MKIKKNYYYYCYYYYLSVCFVLTYQYVTNCKNELNTFVKKIMFVAWLLPKELNNYYLKCYLKC